MSDKKETLSRLKDLNVQYSIRDLTNLDSLTYALGIDYTRKQSFKNTYAFLKDVFKMEGKDSKEYVELLQRTNYFELRELFLHSYDQRIPEGVFRNFQERIEQSEVKNVLLTECEKYGASLLDLIRRNQNTHFTLSFNNPQIYDATNYIFKDFSNLTFVNASIYNYGFIEERFDYIFSIPNFGVKENIKDENFISNQHDLMAMENLLLRLNTNGNLFIVLPANFSFSGGDNEKLRKFILDKYNIKEISELPDKTFRPVSAMKTYFFILTTKETEIITLRKYECVDASRNTPCSAIKVIQESEISKSELKEKSTWNIDVINSENDDDLKKYELSQIKKIALKDCSEIFRGKAVTKNETGNLGVINISNINDLGIDYSGLDYIEESERKVSSYLLKDGDVLMSSRGTVLKVAVFAEQDFPCIPSANLIVIRPEKNLFGKYLKIFLESTLGIKLIKTYQRGTVVVNLNHKDLGQLEVPVLTLDEQKEIIDTYETAMKEFKTTIESAETKWLKVKSSMLERMI